MKPDYKNWMPKGMVLSAVFATAVCLILFIVFGLSGLVSGKLKTVLFVVFLIGTVVGFFVSLWMALMYRAFSYNGKRQMSKQIIEGIADFVKLKDGEKGLDDGSGYEARFSSCGICKLMKEYGLYELTPALCHFDYTMTEASGTAEFVRKYTLASGGPYCDCGYKKNV